MDPWISIAYIATVCLSLMIFCCGDWPIFEGTLIQSIHQSCAGGGFELLEKAVGLICGDPGRRAVTYLEQYCCERPNPILLFFYFTLLGGTFISVVNTSFEFIPGPYVPSIHRYLGTCGVIIGAALFLMTSFSDPGVITSSNVSEYLSMFPYDGILYEEKICTTCNIVRPARSKHCSICGHCIARFDHHCGWTNTCIGENNLRYFLMFLFWHCCLTIYGTAVILAIMAGEVKKHNIPRILTLYYGVENSSRKLFPHILQWLVAYYMPQILIMIFLVATSILLFGFLAYHMYLVVTNTTTNETFKWTSYKRWKSSMLQEAQLNLIPPSKEKQTAGAISSGENLTKRMARATCNMGWFVRKSTSPQSTAAKRDNIYDNGVLHNAIEVFFPRSWKPWVNKLSKHKAKRQ